MTDAAAATGPTGPATRGSVARVGAATAVTALCGYAVLYLAARDLEPAGFSVFSVFWGAFGLVTGAANGLLQEATREVRTALTESEVPERVTHPLRVAAATGVVAAALIACSALVISTLLRLSSGSVEPNNCCVSISIRGSSSGGTPNMSMMTRSG